ncbi:hypothetical protein KDA14_05725 [Candidatus Saccharibacteria bacterium]|nr:hypothetical protein [Candidatus Saccharibacteria bacterium]
MEKPVFSDDQRVDAVSRFPERCRPDMARLCQHISETVYKLERMHEKGESHDEIENVADEKARAAERFCQQGQTQDGTRTICHFGTTAISLPRINREEK